MQFKSFHADENTFGRTFTRPSHEFIEKNETIRLCIAEMDETDRIKCYITVE